MQREPVCSALGASTFLIFKARAGLAEAGFVQAPWRGMLVAAIPCFTPLPSFSPHPGTGCCRGECYRDPWGWLAPLSPGRDTAGDGRTGIGPQDTAGDGTAGMGLQGWQEQGSVPAGLQGRLCPKGSRSHDLLPAPVLVPAVSLMSSPLLLVSHLEAGEMRPRKGRNISNYFFYLSLSSPPCFSPLGWCLPRTKS